MHKKVREYVGCIGVGDGLEESCAFAIVARQTDDIMYSKSIDYFQNRYYVSSSRLLIFVGLWPYQEPSERLVRVRLISFILIVAILCQIFMFIVTDSNMESIIELMQFFLPNLCFSICYWNLNYNIMKVKEMLDLISSYWLMLENQKELMVMLKYAKIDRLCTLMTIFVFYLIFMFLLFPYILYANAYDFDVTKNDTRLILPLNIDYVCTNKICYYFMLLIFCVLVSTICVVGVTHYSTYASFVQYVCALLNVVTIKIEQEIQRKSYHFRSESAFRKEYNSIVSVVKYYNGTINVMNLINSIYRKTYLIELILALIIIIMDFFHFFQLLAFNGNKSKMLSNCIYTVGSIFMIYTICYSGQIIIDHNVNVIRKIYQVSFYELSVKTQKALLLLTMKIMNPCYFSMMGTTMIASHKLFFSIMRHSFSFAMVFYKTC